MLKRFDHDLRLHADPSRVVVRPFHLAWQASGINKSRSERLVAEVLEMEDREAAKQLEAVLRDFEPRHWQTRRVFMTRFEEIDAQMEEPMGDIGDTKRQLIGAYFCHEYSYAAAAIMNPSVVPHWDQSGMPEGSCRFIMSLRTVGEGHISSVAFREGIATEDGELRLAPGRRAPCIAGKVCSIFSDEAQVGRAGRQRRRRCQVPHHGVPGGVARKAGAHTPAVGNIKCQGHLHQGAAGKVQAQIELLK